MRTDRVERTN